MVCEDRFICPDFKKYYSMAEIEEQQTIGLNMVWVTILNIFNNL
jgi:hypothetical protein